MVGIKGLARHLDISIGTVSRALNDKPDVNEKTRRRVLDAAKQLGYTPNQSGRSLRKGATGLIAAMIPDRLDVPLGDTVFMSVLQSLRTELAQHGLDLVVLLCGAEESSFSLLKRTVERGFADGMIISDTLRDDARFPYLMDRNIPFVAFGRTGSSMHSQSSKNDTLKDYCWIDLDFEGIAEITAARLTGFGYRSIALATLNDPLNFHYIFEDALRSALAKRNGYLDDALIIPTDNDDTAGYRIGEHLLSLAKLPDAVVLVDENMAFGLYRRLAEAGLEVGRDIAVIGNVKRGHGKFLSPSLTNFETDLHGLGAALGKALLSQLPAFSKITPPQLVQERWPVELITGYSDTLKK